MTSILSDTEFQAVVETIENDVLQEVMDISVCDLICVLRDSDLTGILNAIVDKVVDDRINYVLDQEESAL